MLQQMNQSKHVNIKASFAQKMSCQKVQHLKYLQELQGIAQCIFATLYVKSSIVVDEYSRFPFAFPCHSAETVISCLNQLFTLFGMPDYIHSDRGPAVVSHDLHTCTIEALAATLLSIILTQWSM